VLLDLKAADGLNNVHVAQGLNRLKACLYQICLLLNFGASRRPLRRLSRPASGDRSRIIPCIPLYLIRCAMLRPDRDGGHRLDPRA
jgi:hypothetical protein